MSDFSFSDDQELQKLNAQVIAEPEDFDNWDKLVRAAEAQEGGLHRNSSPGAIASTRDVYDKLLARFPLFFGYWKKYADLEFTIAGTEAAEMVYERGVASIGTSVDLWANYCGFKVETSHDVDVNRELFERGAESVGLDYLSHPFWDKYLEYEERIEAPERIFAILSRLIRIPMHQYARYFERYRTMSATRTLQELAPPEVFLEFQQEITGGGMKPMSEREIEQELRTRLDAWHMEVFQNNQTETTKRWTYEQNIKRPYFHVTELDEAQLTNWREYLDFEEAEGDYVRTRFLYERCVVTAANYEEFWLRYARWMFAQPDKAEEVRNIYQRASCFYVAISQPAVRLHWAQFEEAENRPFAAAVIYEAILDRMPDHVDSAVALANVHRRHYGIQSAIETVKKYINHPESNSHAQGALVSEWARLLWKASGSPEEARSVFKSHEGSFPDSVIYWLKWLEFEIEQPTSSAEEAERYSRVKDVFNAIRTRSALPPDAIKELASTYFVFLVERGGPDAMKEYMQLDKEIHGPASVAKVVGHADGDEVPSNGQKKGSDAKKTGKQSKKQKGVPVNGS